MGILMSSNRNSNLTTYCDVDWASCPNTKKTAAGFLVKHGKSLISWKLKETKYCFKKFYISRVGVDGWLIQIIGSINKGTY